MSSREQYYRQKYLAERNYRRMMENLAYMFAVTLSILVVILVCVK